MVHQFSITELTETVFSSKSEQCFYHSHSLGKQMVKEQGADMLWGKVLEVFHDFLFFSLVAIRWKSNLECDSFFWGGGRRELPNLPSSLKPNFWKKRRYLTFNINQTSAEFLCKVLRSFLITLLLLKFP